MPLKRCSKCGKEKPLEDFGRNRNTPDELNRWCKDCNRASSKSYREAQPAAHRAACRAWYLANPEYNQERGRRWRSSIREQVFAYYSKTSPPTCSCCGSAENLSIDHIGGDGTEHRNEIFGRATESNRMFTWLISQGFPDGFDVLCKSCNSSKGRGTRCRLQHSASLQT